MSSRAKKIETILIGTSLTEASDQVVRGGVALARTVRAKIHLAHAYAPPMTYSGAPFFPEAALGEVYEAERLALRRQLDNQVHRLGIAPADAGVHLDVGPAHRLLIETAEIVAAGLIVVGSSEEPRLSRFFGSTADRVLRKASCPVLVLRDELALPPRRVLFPVDLSHLAGEAFDRGLDLLEQICGPAERGELPALQALFVAADFCRQHHLARLSPSEGELFSDRELRRFLGLHRRDSWPVEPHVTTGTVEAEILDSVEEWHPDLVILGTHGRGGFERFLLGSVAAAVVREGASNTLVIPPEAAREAAIVEEELRSVAV